MPHLIFFTDLDGTLLDHETYSYAPALDVLERLKQADIPVVLASSKTAAEIVPLQQELGLSKWPAIVENGAGIVWPGENDVAVDDAHARLLEVLEQVEPSLRGKFIGFTQWSVEEVAERTGLSSEAAARARQRRFSEPGIFEGSGQERDAFISALHKLGLDARMGGRFLTISRGATKAGRMREIVERLAGGTKVPTVALGDAPNDIEMLETADIGVIVANPAHAPLRRLDGEAEGRIRRTVLAGPAGWAQSVGDILDEQV